MSNVVTLHADKRWKAVIDYEIDGGLDSSEHYFEEIGDLQAIIEHGPDWNSLIRCVVTLNRSDDGEEQDRGAVGHGEPSPWPAQTSNRSSEG